MWLSWPLILNTLLAFSHWRPAFIKINSHSAQTPVEKLKFTSHISDFHLAGRLEMIDLFKAGIRWHTGFQQQALAVTYWCDHYQIKHISCDILKSYWRFIAPEQEQEPQGAAPPPKSPITLPSICLSHYCHSCRRLERSSMKCSVWDYSARCSLSSGIGIYITHSLVFIASVLNMLCYGAML